MKTVLNMNPSILRRRRKREALARRAREKAEHHPHRQGHRGAAKVHSAHAHHFANENNKNRLPHPLEEPPVVPKRQTSQRTPSFWSRRIGKFLLSIHSGVKERPLKPNGVATTGTTTLKGSTIRVPKQPSITTEEGDTVEPREASPHTDDTSELSVPFLCHEEEFPEGSELEFLDWPEQEEESLMSAWSYQDYQDDYCSLDSELYGLERIRQHFDRRSALLQKLTLHKSEIYTEMMLQQELETRNYVLQQYRLAPTPLTQNSKLSEPQSTPDSDKKCNVLPNLPSSADPYASLGKRILAQVVLEGHHASEAVWIILWYCIGHSAMYMSMELGMKVMEDQFKVSENLLNFGLILWGFLVKRCNGYLWFWLGQSSYRLVKFDMHNRQILGYWDTRIWRWCRRQCPQFNTALSIVAFYAIYIGISHFYSELWEWCESQLWTYVYPPIENHWITTLKRHRLSFDSCDSLLKIPTSDTAFSSSWTMNILQGRGTPWLWHKACLEFHDSDLPLLSLSYHAVMGLLAFLIMRVYGASLFEL